MKFLKKTFAYILPAMMVLGGATACTDFIEIDPENKVPEQGVDFTNKNNMYQPVVGAYSKVRTQGMHWCNALLMFTRDGDVWSGRTDDQGDAVAFGRKFNYNNSFWALNQVWMNFYDIIRITNAALQSLDGYAEYLAAGSEDYKTYESYCGEVRTIRAWAYYCLVTNFGSTVIYRDNLQTDFRRSTVEAVYNYMLEDLNYAIDKLPRMRPNQMEHKGAVTAFTAQALAARIYLLKGDYAQVETLTDDIIKNGGFRLYDDFYQLFKIPGKLCDESLFECQVTDYGNGSGDYLGVDQWFNFQGPNMAERYDEVVNADGTISYKQAEGTKSIGGWNFIGYEPEFVAWAEARGEGPEQDARGLAGRSHIGHQDRLLERQRLPSLQSDDSSTYDLRSQQQCAYHPLCRSAADELRSQSQTGQGWRRRLQRSAPACRHEHQNRCYPERRDGRTPDGTLRRMVCPLCGLGAYRRCRHRTRSQRMDSRKDLLAHTGQPVGRPS